MTPDRLEALIAAVPSIAALIWVIVRQQTQIDKLVTALLTTQDTLLKLHPPQTVETAKMLAETGS